MKKNILFLTLLCAFSSAFAQVPSVSASTKWAVIDGNTTWVPSALDFKNYCLLGLDGGTTGQVLTKDSGTDYDWSWQTPSGGGGSDFLGTGFTSGGGTGSIPDETHAEVQRFSFKTATNVDDLYSSLNFGSQYSAAGTLIEANGYSSFLAGDPAIDDYFAQFKFDGETKTIDIQGIVVSASTNQSIRVGPYDGVLLSSDNSGDGLLQIAITPFGVAVSDTRATPLGIEYAADYSATIAPNDRSVPDVGTVKKLGLEGLNKMTSAAKEALTPSEGWEVWDTDLHGKCVWDGVKWLRLSQKSTPSVAVGAGAGTGATVSVVGNDIEGMITLTGGTGATASATVFTLTFFDSYTTAPHGVIISESNQKALLMPIGRKPGFDTVSTTTFTVINASVNGIANADVYIYAYRVIQ